MYLEGHDPTQPQKVPRLLPPPLFSVYNFLLHANIYIYNTTHSTFQKKDLIANIDIYSAL